VFWIRWCRQTPWFVLIVVTFVNVGMWYERFVIIVQSLHHDFLPSSWGRYYPTWVDWVQMIGDFGLFFTLTLLFVRFLPMISIAEIKGVLPMASPHPYYPPDAEYLKASGEYPTEDHKLAAAYRPPLHAAKEVKPAEQPVPAFAPGAGGTGTPWGVAAEFANPRELLAAAKRARHAGYRLIDAWSPYPVHGMISAIGRARSRLPLWTLAGALTGLAIAVTMQFYLSTYYYPIIVSGKEYRSWEAFVPIFFELTVLFAGFFTLFALLGLCGLPRFYHPLDNHPTFRRSTLGGFFLTVEAADPKFDPDATRAFLEAHGGKHVAVVES
jgi:hypothetical protein